MNLEKFMPFQFVGQENTKLHKRKESTARNVHKSVITDAYRDPDPILNHGKLLASSCLHWQRPAFLFSTDLMCATSSNP